MPPLASDPLWVMGDGVRLVQVLANLLNNAARYTPEGGTIEVHCQREPDRQVSLRVSDNGRGISRAFLGHVFEAFSQEEQRTGAGLGLGLSVVRQLVSMHDGDVTAHSEGPGKGSQFRVLLPLTSAPALPLMAAAAAAVDNAARPLKIVLIDDNEDIRDLMSELLRRWGHRVEVAPDGEQGCALTLSAHPDIAFVDIGLPGMDGYGVATRLRENLRRDQLRLVAMTGFGQESDKRRALEAGFDLHIVKPASVEALKQALSF
jgi:CheY-like chemotaxis protein